MSALATFSTVAGSLKTLADTVKTMVNLRDSVAFQAKANELQSQISAALADAISAYDAQSTQLQHIRELEEEIGRMKAWEAEKQRYELKDLGWGALAYMLKTDARNTEPPHWVCTNCYGQRRISIIQYAMKKGEGRRLCCPACHMQIRPSSAAMEGDGAKWLD
jgi:Zn finger protein HypA/HybF involved in hydrogenase expression